MGPNVEKVYHADVSKSENSWFSPHHFFIFTAEQAARPQFPALKLPGGSTRCCHQCYECTLRLSCSTQVQVCQQVRSGLCCVVRLFTSTTPGGRKLGFHSLSLDGNSQQEVQMMVMDHHSLTFHQRDISEVDVETPVSSCVSCFLISWWNLVLSLPCVGHLSSSVDSAHSHTSLWRWKRSCKTPSGREAAPAL